MLTSKVFLRKTKRGKSFNFNINIGECSLYQSQKFGNEQKNHSIDVVMLYIWTVFNSLNFYRQSVESCERALLAG